MNTLSPDGSAVLRGEPRAFDWRVLLPGVALVALAAAWLYAPTMRWLIMRWQGDEYYAHGPMLPLITAYLIWRQREDLSRAWHSRPLAGGGTWLLLLGLLMQLGGTLADIGIVQAASIPVVLLGIARYAGGAAFERPLRFPLLYLWMAIPLSHVMVQLVTVPLQNNAASYAAMFLGLGGLPIERTGVNLHTSQYNFVVDVPCSGLKTALTLLTLSLVVAHLLPNLSNLGRALLSFLSLPIAFFANTLRIIVIVMIGHFYGVEAAEGFFHNFSGMFMFVVALALLVGCGSLLGNWFPGHEADPDAGSATAASPPAPQNAAPA